MFATRRLTIALAFATALVAVTAGSALAQGGSPNPSGGTLSCLPAIVDCSGSIDLTAYLPRGFTIDLGARSWLVGWAAARHQVTPTASRPLSVHTLTAVSPRRIWSR